MRTRAHVPLDGIGDGGARRHPAATGAKIHILGPKNLHLAVSAPESAAGPALVWLSAVRVPGSIRLPTANLKGHQCAAVVQVDADPVPPRRLRVQIFTGPFVVEPGLTDHACRGAVARNGACNLHMR